MTKLLSANILRLWKNKFFWIGVAFMAFMGIFVPINGYINTKKYSAYVLCLDGLFFNYVMYIGILLAIFCSLFIGTEYSDGTIRNKIVIGHNRAAIYFSNLLVNILAGLILCVVNILLYLAVGIPLLGFFYTDIKIVLIFAADSFIMMVAFSTIYTLIAMLCTSKAAAGIICVSGVFISFLVSGLISSGLSMPESYLDEYIEMGYTEEELEDIVAKGDDINPFYIRGTQRQICEFFDVFLPTGQAIHLSEFDWNPNPIGIMPIYSILIAIATTGVGVIFFHKKDLK